MAVLFNYTSPEISNSVSFAPDSTILSGSVIDSADIVTTGQETDNVYEDASSFGGSSFNTEWGD